MKLRDLLAIHVGAGFFGVCLMTPALHAQTVPARPGLWASASQVILNGKPMPTLFDIRGIPETKKQGLRTAMAQAGLPAGWNPSLTCEKRTQIQLQSVLQDMKAEGCNPQVTSNTGNHIAGKVQCEAHGTAASGTVDITGIGSGQVTYVLNMSGTMMGQPMTYKATTVSKFIGADCSILPAGVDIDMLGER